jgi:hypothetical protein
MVPNRARSQSRVGSSQLSLDSSSPRRVGRDNSASDSSGFSSSPSALGPASTARLARDRRQQHHDHYDIIDPENHEHDLPDNTRNHDSSSHEESPNIRRSPPIVTASTSASATSTTQDIKMPTSTHRRLQDVLNASVAPEKPSAPVLSTSNARRTNPTNSLPPPRLLKRSSSSVRLTTSLEGKATVILEDGESTSSPPVPLPSPGPPQQKYTPARNPQRPLSTQVDSKLWEFCCDNQSAIRSPARTPPQPSEATQALRLLRTRSNSGGVSSLLRSLSQTEMSNPPSSSQPKKTLAKAPRERKVITSNKAARPKNLGINGKDIYHEPSVDSDKENRPPGAPVSPPPERSNSRKALGVSGKGAVVPTTTKRGKTRAGVSRKVLLEKMPSSGEDVYSTSQESVGSVSADSPRRIDEIECVENLLSLRGGTWR